MLRKGTIITLAMFGLVRPALAGPPYVSEDPEPTDYKHFEIYTFSNGTATKGDIGGATDVDFNTGPHRISRRHYRRASIAPRQPGQALV